MPFATADATRRATAAPPPAPPPRPPPAPMAPAPALLRPTHSGPPPEKCPPAGLSSKALQSGRGKRNIVPLCARRGCLSYAVPQGWFCGEACAVAAREAVSAHRSPYAPGFVERIEELIAQGNSRRQIGEIFGVSKNVIAGVWGRHLARKRWIAAPPPAPPAKPPKPPKTAQPAKPAKRAKAARPARRGTTVARGILVRARDAALREASPIRVAINTMPGEGCQFPISENPWRVCDAPRVPSSPAATRLSPYCACHAARCYGKLPKAA